MAKQVQRPAPAMAPAVIDNPTNEAAGDQDTTLATSSRAVPDGSATTKDCDTKNDVDSVKEKNAAADAEREAISYRNAIESPLLCLPAELRLRIWRFAAGGKIVAISVKATGDFRNDYQDRMEKMRFCIVPPHDTEHFCVPIPFGHSHHDPRAYPAAPIFTRGLAAGICRQIRKESLNLHFKLTIFHLLHCRHLDFLENQLTRTQMQAIHYISGEGYYTVYDIVSEELISRIRLIFPNVKQIFYDGPKRLGTRGPEEMLGINVVYTNALDRNKSLKDAHVQMF